MTPWELPAVVLALVTWLNAPSPSLGDLAKREALRRQMMPKATHSLVSSDLPAGQLAPVSIPVSTTGPDEAAAGEKGTAGAADDKSKREEIEARNQLDALVYRVEKDSKEWVDKLPADAKTRLDEAVTKGKDALRTGATAGIRTALDELNAAYSAAGAAMYQSQQASQEGAAQPETGPADATSGAKQDDVVEADYEIVDDKK